MPFSKAFLLLGLLFAVLLILSDKVSCRELAEAAQTLTEGNVKEAKNWGFGHGHSHWGFGHGHGHWGFGHGHGRWGFGHGRSHWGFGHGHGHWGFGHGHGHWGFGHGHGHWGHAHGHGHWGHGHKGIPGHNGVGGKVEKENEAGQN